MRSFHTFSHLACYFGLWYLDCFSASSLFVYYFMAVAHSFRFMTIVRVTTNFHQLIFKYLIGEKSVGGKWRKFWGGDGVTKISPDEFFPRYFITRPKLLLLPRFYRLVTILPMYLTFWSGESDENASKWRNFPPTKKENPMK